MILGYRSASVRIAGRLHTSTEVSFTVSVLTRYVDRSANSVAPPNISPWASQSRRIFCPSGVIEKCLARPFVIKNSSVAGAPWWVTTALGRNRRGVAWASMA